MQKEAIGNADRFLPLKPSSATNNSSFVSVCYLSDQVVGADDVGAAASEDDVDADWSIYFLVFWGHISWVIPHIQL